MRWISADKTGCPLSPPIHVGLTSKSLGLTLRVPQWAPGVQVLKNDLEHRNSCVGLEAIIENYCAMGSQNWRHQQYALDLADKSRQRSVPRAHNLSEVLPPIIWTSDLIHGRFSRRSQFQEHVVRGDTPMRLCAWCALWLRHCLLNLEHIAGAYSPGVLLPGWF